MKSLPRVDIYFKAMVVPESRRKFKIFESVHMMRTFLYMNVCVLPFQIGAWSQQILSYLHSLAGYYTQHRKTPENRLPALERRGPCLSVAFPSLCGELEWTGASKAEGSVGPHANIAGAVTTTATRLQCTEFMLCAG